MPKRPTRNDAPPIDHPQPIGDLAEIFERRRIAVATDGNGNVILARPDSVVVDPQDDPNRVNDLVRRVAERNDKEAKRIERDAKTDGIALVRVPVPDAGVRDLNKERRWSVQPALDQVAAYRADGYRCELNHVLLGAQVFLGDPLGAHATWVGDMAFPSSTTTSGGKAALLSTAQPVAPPSYLRPALQLADRRRPRVLVLDTGLRTLDGAGEQAEHPTLSNCKLHTPWFRDPAVGAKDDEDEHDDDGAGTLDFEAGHGTFITGIVRQICPDAEVVHGRRAVELRRGRRVARVDRRHPTRHRRSRCGPFDIVVMSFGDFCADDDRGCSPTGSPRCSATPSVVAAAGNQHDLPPVLPGGAARRHRRRRARRDGQAWFTNFGGWVDACAPAIDVVSTFFNDVTEKLDGRSRRAASEGGRGGAARASPRRRSPAAIAQEMYLVEHRSIAPTRRGTGCRRTSDLRCPDLGVVFNV